VLIYPHHTDPTSKVADVSRLVWSGAPLLAVLAGAAQCAPRCVVCHRRPEAGQLAPFRAIPCAVGAIVCGWLRPVEHMVTARKPCYADANVQDTAHIRGDHSSARPDSTRGLAPAPGRGAAGARRPRVCVTKEAGMVIPEQPRPAPLRNRVRDLWRAGTPSISLILTIPSVQTVQVLAHAGFDSLVVDMEHGPIDIATAHAMIVATAGTPAVPYARLPANLPWLAKPLLDAGALGVIFPLSRDRADAEAAVRAARYPPRGERSWGPFYAPLRWDRSMQDYLDTADDAVIVALLIETAEAVRNIDAIVATPGVDLAIIGGGDLATAMGHHGRVEQADVRAAIARAEAAILRSGVVLGGAARSTEQANELIARGYRHISLGFDWALLQRGAAGLQTGIRRGDG
jgi:4-hydroxy-2-oxoheptanedioate aldolase